jgi:DNA repair protein RadC
MTFALASARPAFPTRGVSTVEALSDRESLRLLLDRSLRQRADSEAADLLQRFGSLAAVLAADEAALRAVIAPRAVTDLRLAHELACPDRGRAGGEARRNFVCSSTRRTS